MLRACLVICAECWRCPNACGRFLDLCPGIVFDHHPVHQDAAARDCHLRRRLTPSCSPRTETPFSQLSRVPRFGVAIDRATGKPLHSYIRDSQYRAASRCANGSQIYVGTCPANNFVCQGYVEVFDVASGAHLALSKWAAISSARS